MAPNKIGVAGYMGSGKSMCAKYLSREGGSIIDADSLAKDMMNSSPAIKKSLSESFGNDVVVEDRILFDVLGGVVFSSLQNLKQLNSIVHPPLLEQLHRTISECNKGPCILDAALIPYWKIEGWFDTVYWIEASEEVRFRRIAEGSSITSEELRKRIELQKELFVAPAGGGWITIPNEGTISEFEEIINTFINK